MIYLKIFARPAALLLACTGLLSAMAQTTPKAVANASVRREVALKVGDPAPPLVAAKWIKGTPVTTYLPGKVYVVEFWATWCGPCRASMPHLSELANRYKDKAVVVSFNVQELIAGKDKNGDYVAKVERFVKRLGDGMDYTVAADTRDGVMWNTWMKAAGLGGIPAAFIIDQTGKIAWIGHPAMMDKVLDMVVQGSYDENGKQQLAEWTTERRKKTASLKAELATAEKNGDFNKAIEFTEAISDISVFDVASMFIKKYELLNQVDAVKARQFALESMKTRANDPLTLQALAMSIVNKDGQNEGKPDYALALSIMKQVTSRFDTEDPFAASNLAKAYYKAGDLTNAVKTQQKVIDILNDVSLVEQKQSVKDQARKDMATYQSAMGK